MVDSVSGIAQANQVQAVKRAERVDKQDEDKRSEISTRKLDDFVDLSSEAKELLELKAKEQASDVRETLQRDKAESLAQQDDERLTQLS